jgi:hypothetical protein
VKKVIADRELLRQFPLRQVRRIEVGKNQTGIVAPRHKLNEVVFLRLFTNYIDASTTTGDLVHRFYTQQLQIDNGALGERSPRLSRGRLCLGLSSTNNPAREGCSSVEVRRQGTEMSCLQENQGLGGIASIRASGTDTRQLTTVRCESVRRLRGRDRQVAAATAPQISVILRY